MACETLTYPATWPAATTCGSVRPETPCSAFPRIACVARRQQLPTPWESLIRLAVHYYCMKTADSDARIIIDPTPLDDAHAPSKLVSRETALKRLVGSFRSCRAPPLPRWLVTGPSGSGKTALARAALGQIAANGALVAEVNCWQAKSPFAVMDALVRDLRILGAAAHDTNAKRERLERLLRDKQLVVLLDEIDRPSPSARNAILYAVSTLPNVGIIAAAQDATMLLTLEPRVRSRFQPTELKLSGYPKSDLAAILNDRADTALRSGTWSDETVIEIVSRASSDARRAIGLLTASARAAEADRSPRIETEHIRSAIPSALDQQYDALPDWLTTHHALIHELVVDKGPIATSDLYARYAVSAKKRQMIPAARRTFTDYVSSLIHAGKLTVDDALTKGNHRVVRVPADEPTPKTAKGRQGEADSPSSS